mgnify:FL=1
MNISSFNKTDFVESIKNHNFVINDHKSPDKFRDSVEELVTEVFLLGIKTTSSENDNQPKIKQLLIEKDKHISNVCNTYAVMDSRYKTATDYKEQYQSADLIERKRYLLFRILTATGIAAVILLTGYLAQKLNIPLPLLKLAG